MASPSILFLDDDADLRESVVIVFDVLGKVCLAVDSMGAMIEARKSALSCELAILDVNLGEGLPSGVDAYEWLRAQGFGGRIVFLTGHAPNHPAVARAAALGAVILRKPIAAAELRGLVASSGAA